ncbi:hypothetical protein AB0P21_40730 [Kribbella sp. NPDC056861]|uniref:hypothetical protein n=1 Tax=Kribbella sp. NPDC056861 TaxID=3154857 RepID=UPI00341B0FB7
MAKATPSTAPITEETDEITSEDATTATITEGEPPAVPSDWKESDGSRVRVAASAVLARVAQVNLGDGTVGDLIPVVHRAFGELDEIAQTAVDEIDRLTVLRMKESLLMLTRPEDPGLVLGLAAPDGTLLLDATHITDPLREMYEDNADPDESALRRYRFAISELFHQQSLLAVEEWDEAERRSWADPAVRLFETGVNALWTAARLPDHLIELGLDKVAPGIEAVSVPAGYPVALPAAEHLIGGVATAGEQTPEELLRTLVSLPPTAKFAELGRVLLTSAQLLPVIPPEDFADVSADLYAALRAPFEALAVLDVTDIPEVAVEATARQAANLAFAAAYDVLAAATERYHVEEPSATSATSTEET